MMIRKFIKSNKSLNKSCRQIKAAKFDAEAFRKRHKAAQENSAAKKEERKEGTVIQIQQSDDPMQEAFELLVPSSGKANSKAGELIRAMMRIMYRDYNDGDLFYEGYGIETCGDAVAFLCDKIPDLEDKFEDIAMRHLEENSYTKAIEAISREVLDEIYENPDLIIEKNTEDMFDWDGKDFISDHDWEPEYEFECELPENVYAHLENEDISERDLEYELQNWDYLGDADISLNGWGGITITGINRETYDELEYSMYNWLEQWGEDLDEEYGSEYDDEE